LGCALSIEKYGNTKYSINFEISMTINCDQILKETGTKSKIDREA
jgi:hypothetical protein